MKQDKRYHQPVKSMTKGYTIARLLLAGLFISLGAQAQKIEIGAGLGGLLYKGDIVPNLTVNNIRPAANLFFRYNATKSVSFRVSLMGGQIVGDDRHSRDPFQQARNASFHNGITEASGDIEYNFRNFKSMPNVRNWTPYVFGGLGFYNYRNLNTNKSTVALGFPLGVGVKYEFSRPWSLGFEFGTRFTSNDNLDGIGATTGVNKLQQGDTALKDKYTYTAITLSYTFYKIFCP